MELGSDNLDFGKLVNTRGNTENVTPHKIAVIAFIREYGLLKMEAKEMINCTMAPKYRKDFCILALKLIQCPDMEFKDLESLLTDGRYNLLSVHLQNFCVRLQNIYVNGISALIDCVVSTIDKLMVEQSETNPCVISRSSIIGFYLRRLWANLDRFTFGQVVSLYKSFCLYYQRGRPGLMMRSLSKEKLNNMEPQAQAASTSPVLPEESKSHELSMKMNIIDRDNFEECQWSRKQAELFTAQQVNLLEINESKALPPQQLQKTVMQIINDIPDYPEVHFLSYLNCLRIREFCGAQDSLYNCFDRSLSSISVNTASNDRNTYFRYAALNRAYMLTRFGYNSAAMEGVREALALSQLAADKTCLAAASACGALAAGRALRSALLKRRTPCADAAVAHLTAQHDALNGKTPADVFQSITNYIHTFMYDKPAMDLTITGLANAAAMWSLYGKTEMASVTCQLLLNLNAKYNLSVCRGGESGGGVGGVCVWREASAACGAGVARACAWRGRPALAAALASRHTPFARDAAAKVHAELALRAGKWEEADQNIRQLETFDRWESQLLKAEMYFLKGDATEALESLQDVLDYCKTEDDCQHYIALRLRAMILMSEVQHSYSSIQSTNIMLLNEALALAKKYHLHYFGATAEMHIANVQLHMGCAKNALLIARRALPSLVEHGSAYDVARALLLYTKCRIATAPICGEARVQVIQSCCDALEVVKQNFTKVGAQARLLHSWYIQAQLYNDIGNQAARNHCAWMYRQLETQHPVEQSNILLVMY